MFRIKSEKIRNFQRAICKSNFQTVAFHFRLPCAHALVQTRGVGMIHIFCVLWFLLLTSVFAFSPFSFLQIIFFFKYLNNTLLLMYVLGVSRVSLRAKRLFVSHLTSRDYSHNEESETASFCCKKKKYEKKM